MEGTVTGDEGVTGVGGGMGKKTAIKVEQSDNLLVDIA